MSNEWLNVSKIMEEEEEETGDCHLEVDCIPIMNKPCTSKKSHVSLDLLKVIVILDFPEPMPVVGISRSAKAYSLISVLETMKTYCLEDGLTEEELLTFGLASSNIYSCIHL